MKEVVEKTKNDKKKTMKDKGLIPSEELENKIREYEKKYYHSDKWSKKELKEKKKAYNDA